MYTYVCIQKFRPPPPTVDTGDQPDQQLRLGTRGLKVIAPFSVANDYGLGQPGYIKTDPIILGPREPFDKEETHACWLVENVVEAEQLVAYLKSPLPSFVMRLLKTDFVFNDRNGLLDFIPWFKDVKTAQGSTILTSKDTFKDARCDWAANQIATAPFMYFAMASQLFSQPPNHSLLVSPPIDFLQLHATSTARTYAR